jgi:acyl carrier protein
MEDVREQLRSYLATNVLFSDNGYPFSDDASFLENGVVDSMSVMELVLFSEKTFSISISDRELIPANLDSVENLAAFVMRKQAVRA